MFFFVVMQNVLDVITACHFIYSSRHFSLENVKLSSLFYDHVLDSDVKPISSSQLFKYILPTTDLLNAAWNKTKNHRVSVCAQKHMLVTVGNVYRIFDR